MNKLLFILHFVKLYIDISGLITAAFSAALLHRLVQPTLLYNTWTDIRAL